MAGQQEVTCPSGTARGTVRVPPSKSLTHRAMILAALAQGESVIASPLESGDTRATRECLSLCGATFSETPDGLLARGLGGPLRPPPFPLSCADSGTTLRLLMALCAASPGGFTLDASPQLRARPVGPLAEALRSVGAAVRFCYRDGFPPLYVEGGRWTVAEAEVDGSLSSQFLSGLMLGASLAEGPILLRAKGLVSRPYAEMTAAMLARAGVPVEPLGRDAWRVCPATPGALRWDVEPDASSASCFLAAAAVTGGSVRIPGLKKRMLQGDAAILGLLKAFGARVVKEKDCALVEGGHLKGLEAGVADTPDLVPALVAVALFADGPTRLSGVGHLRYKESDRLAVLASAVSRLGGSALLSEDSIEIRPPQRYTPADLDPRGDHRMAMAFAVMAARVPGTRVLGPDCVSKSFPGFWEKWERLFAP